MQRFKIASRLAIIAIVSTLAAACGKSDARPAPAVGRGLQVVELFQSQGCSSCPPANANVLKLADRKDILTLSWQVTYWDYLGWKDSLAQPAFTQRQHDYARSLRHDGVWTPQVVINGRGDVVGVDKGEVEGALLRFARDEQSVAITLAPGKVSVSGATGTATVYLVRYDPRIVQIPIRAGENGGRTLPHRNTVREYAKLGTFTGGTRNWQIAAPTRPGLKTAVLVQAGQIGHVIAAAHD